MLVLAALCLSQMPAAAQNDEKKLTPEVIARLFPKPVVSPDYNSDGTVTFRFKAPDASSVELDCQGIQGRRQMTKDEDGVWSVTVKFDVPDIYPYGFIADGMQVADPSNMYIFPNEGFKSSLVDVRGEAPSVQDMQDVPHGRVSYRWYHSSRLGFDRPLCIYTPAGYSPSGREKLPVLYLIHGMTDTYETWFKVGRVNVIMDNLTAAGAAERMIVVMPYANPFPEMALRGSDRQYDPMDTEIVAREIIDGVMPFVESEYSVLTDADHRAVAGFSLGGRQTLATGLGHPDLFHYVAAFSPAIFGDEWNRNFENGTYASPDVLGRELKLMRLCCGTEDFLLQASKGLDEALTERGVEHVTWYPGGGHTWMNCRDYIEITARELFK